MNQAAPKIWPELFGPRAVAHLNVADFAAAVERVVDPRLKDRPVIVAPEGAARAAVYDMSDEAYQAGVRKGMALRRAVRVCPGARVVPPHPDHYERAMAAFARHAFPFSPLVEAEERTGHLFVDLTGIGRLFGPPPDVAWRLRREVKKDLGLEPIWSVAPNKLTAKVATRLVKPTGEYIVEAGEEEDFLLPLPIRLLPGIELEDLLRLREVNVLAVAEVRLWTPEQLGVFFGSRAMNIYRLVRGRDDSPVLPAGRKKPVVRRDHEFGEDVNDRRVVEAVLYRLVEGIGRELRERGLAARRLALSLEYSDGVRVVRQRGCSAGTANDFKLHRLAGPALGQAWVRRVRIRRLSLVGGRLTYPSAQLDLFEVDEDEGEANRELLAALDQIRRKFGSDAIGSGRTWGLAS